MQARSPRQADSSLPPVPKGVRTKSALPIPIYLDLQLKKHGIQQIIVIGLIAHTCIEATVRFAGELGKNHDGKGRDGGLLG